MRELFAYLSDKVAERPLRKPKTVTYRTPTTNGTTRSPFITEGIRTFLCWTVLNVSLSRGAQVYSLAIRQIFSEATHANIISSCDLGAEDTVSGAAFSCPVVKLVPVRHDIRSGKQGSRIRDTTGHF